MKSEVIDWEQDLPLDADEAYRSLVRSLKRTDGFSLLFVRCSPIQGEQIITDIGNDLKDKNIKVLELDESIDNLYDRIAALDDLEHLNILFIKGIEQSIFAYEDREVYDINLRSRSLQYSGTWHNVPRVLGHLNLSRERFRDNFKFCIVFLLPEFALRYFIRRAPDFFDWRSNIYDFPTEKSLVDQESYRLVRLYSSFDEYQQLTNEQRISKLCQIKSYIDESSDLTRTSELWFEKGIIHAAANEYEEGIAAFDQALQIKPDDYEAWYNRGIALDKLGRYEEAIAAFDQALQIKPDYHLAWHMRGYCFEKLGQYEESLKSHNKAVRIKPDYAEGWYNQGVQLSNLGRNEEAIAAYDQALKIKPALHEAWNNRGIALGNLGRYEEDIAACDKALEFKPDLHEAWNNRGIALGSLGRYEEAITAFDQALQIKLDLHEVWSNRGSGLGSLGRYEEAIVAFDQALQIKPDLHEVWSSRSRALGSLGRYEEAIESYEKVLKLTDNINKQVEILQIISSLYLKSGKIREGLATTQRMTEFLQSTNTPMSEISVYPQWMRKLIKFGESGKIQGFILAGLVIISVPIWVPVAIFIFMFRIVSQIAMKRTP